MSQKPKPNSYLASGVVAAVLIATTFVLARNPSATTAEQKQAIASAYKLVRHDLPGAPGGLPPRDVRPTHPSCARIAAWVSALGGSCALADLDGDGLPNDIIFTDQRTEQVIVAPVPGTGDRYAPFTLTAGGVDRPNVGTGGVLVGDFNEDGLPDVLVHFMGRSPLVFIHKPGTSGRLSAADFEAPIELTADTKGLEWYTVCAVLADLDGDGRLDLVLGNYFPDGSGTYDPKAQGVQEMINSHGWATNGAGVRFFLGRKPTADDPHYFKEAKSNLEPKAIHGWTLAVGACDLDGDMLPELYIGNDFGPDRLLHNRSTPGSLRFEVVQGRKGFAVPSAFVIGHDTYHGMGVDFCDVNGDGLLDFFVSNVTCEYGLQESHFLWVSDTEGPRLADGGAPFTQQSERYGVSRSGWGWDVKFESFANQVQPDLVQATGFFKGEVNRWPELQSLATGNSAFLPDPRNWPNFKKGGDVAGDNIDAFFAFGPDGRYHNVNREVGIDTPMVTRAIATADVDGDGRMDVAFANMWGQSYFFHNECPKPGAFLGLRLLLPRAGTEGTIAPFQELDGRPPFRGSPAIGAVARVKLPNGRTLVRQVDGGSGHSGKRSQEIHFGLGDVDPATPLDVSIKWRQPDGKVADATIKMKPNAWRTIVLGNGKEPR